MIDPIEVAQLDEMFETWLYHYRSDLLEIDKPVILVDASLPGYLELITEMDLLLEREKVIATVQSISSDNTFLNELNVVLCVTRKDSMLSTLAQVRIFGVTSTDLGQVWELRDH